MREAMDVDNGYFQDSISVPSSPPTFDFLAPFNGIPFDIVKTKAIRKLLREVQLLDENALQEPSSEPDVFSPTPTSLLSSTSSALPLNKPVPFELFTTMPLDNT